jgi:hypothetical protein
MTRRLVLLALAPLVSLLAQACDGVDGTAPGGTSGAGGVITRCDLGITEVNPGTRGFGEGCAADSECDFGVCLQPGAAGNLTNGVFGFCTRGCDCGNDTASRLTPAEKEDLACLYPPTPDQHERHVVVQCATLDDCKRLDERWTACKTLSTGGVARVCHAE